MGEGDVNSLRRGLLRDLRRLVELGDVVYYVGSLLYRRSLRYTLFTAGIGILGYLTRLAGVAGFTARQAIALPLLVGGSSLLGGLTLKLIPTILASRKLKVAQANDLNLMEDYRKSRQEAHLEQLWQRIFRHEPALEGELASAGDDDETPRETFLRLAHYALDHPLPQVRQRYHVGLDLRYFEDWRDGAFFDRTDDKLAQQFDGDAVLAGVKREAALGLARRLRRALDRLGRRFWFTLTTRAVSLAIADALSKLNRRYDTDMFNSQVLLWPGEEDQPWLGDLENGRQSVLEYRRRLLTRVFGPGRPRAAVMILRLFAPDLLAATRLRLCYDPDYLMGRLDFDATSDLEQVGIHPAIIAGVSKSARGRRKLQAEAEAWLARQDEWPTGLEGPAPRAGQIALITAPRRLVTKAISGDAEAGRALMSRCREAIQREHIHNHRLVCLRLHHELTRLQISEYHRLVEQLQAGTAEVSATEAAV
jgi:hypothetical protein